MKGITNEQIEALMNDIYRLDPKVQTWAAFQKFFASLPEAKIVEKKDEEKKKDK